MTTAGTRDNAHRPITERDKQLIDQHATLWIDRAMRTDPIEPEKIIPAIEGLYRHAGMKTPRVVIVRSPLVMAFAFGAAAAIWHCRKHNVDVASGHANGMANAALGPEIGECSNIYSATVAAIHQATNNYCPTHDKPIINSNITTPTDQATIFTAIDGNAYTATRSHRTAAYDAADTLNRKSWTSILNAVINSRDHKSWTSILYAGDTKVNTTSAVTRDPLYDALIHATELPSDAARACSDLAGDLGIQCSQRWWNVYQGGNMWAAREFYMTACRDILDLDLPHRNAYACWEQAAVHGSFRVLHDEFCVVSDFPEIILKDQQNRPHSQTGPSHRWRDGWTLYHWHGTRVPAKWIEDKTYLTPTMALSQTNLELRRAACEILGWTNIHIL